MPTFMTKGARVWISTDLFLPRSFFSASVYPIWMEGGVGLPFVAFLIVGCSFGCLACQKSIKSAISIFQMECEIQNSKSTERLGSHYITWVMFTVKNHDKLKNWNHVSQFFIDDQVLKCSVLILLPWNLRDTEQIKPSYIIKLARAKLPATVAGKVFRR